MQPTSPPVFDYSMIGQGLRMHAHKFDSIIEIDVVC